MKRIGFALIVIACATVTSLSQNPKNIKFALTEGKVVVDTVHSAALENNFLGDSPDRPVSIYLPPGYDTSPDKHYPVIYFLHSYGVDHTAFFGGYPWDIVDFGVFCDDLISSGEIDPMIVVSPNAYNKYWGSFYTNSIVTGDWADFIIVDLIDYMDSNFRTLRQKESRGLAGHSMGGYGTIWLAMNYPEVFNAVYMFSADVDQEALYLGSQKDKMIEAVKATSIEGLEWETMVIIAAAAAWAPDTSAPPKYGQFPLDDSGNLIDSIWQKWLQHDPLSLLPSYKDSLMKLRAIQFDVGKYDIYSGFIGGNRKFSQALSDLDIPHVFEEHYGNHSNKLAERIKSKLLPFFSHNLSNHLLSDTVLIPDTAFLNALIEEGVDTNGDSLISFAEAEAVIALNVHDEGISKMTGIEAFINMEILDCGSNELTILDVSNNIALTELDCGSTQLTSLDVSNNIALKKLSCYGNTGGCWPGYPLTSLDVSGCTALEYLNCRETSLITLDVSNNTSLKYLICDCNTLTTLDVSNNTVLDTLYCSGNELASLDVSNNPALAVLDCSSNLLTSLDVSISKALVTLYLSNIPTLYEVCVWEMPFPPSGVEIDTTGSPNVEFKDCSGTGIEKYDESRLSIYPNPTNNLFTIETDQFDHYSIEITTLNGQQILTGEMEGTSYQIDLSTFKKGVYFITIRSKDFVTTRKIIKL